MVKFSLICILSSNITNSVTYVILLIKMEQLLNFSSIGGKMWLYWLFLCVFPYVLFIVTAAMLVGGGSHYTHFYRNAI
jgi:hypothetical protein